MASKGIGSRSLTYTLLDASGKPRVPIRYVKFDPSYANAHMARVALRLAPGVAGLFP